MTIGLTPLAALEVAAHEGLCREAYLDSVGCWTWSIGITSKSGHSVERYKDNPQPMQRCLEVWVWVLQRYADDVAKAFDGVDLTEAQFAAALSFHFNTGAIGKATWVKKFKAGGPAATVEAAFMEWKNPPEVLSRRRAEANLFFRGVWSGDGKVTVYDVSHSTYSPIWSSGRRVSIAEEVTSLLPAAPTTLEERLTDLEARVAAVEALATSGQQEPR